MGRKDIDQETPEDGFKHEDPVVDEALEWFARLRNTTADPATRAAFERWLATSPRHVQEYRDLEAMWSAPSFAKAVDSLPIAPASVATPEAQSLAGACAPFHWWPPS